MVEPIISNGIVNYDFEDSTDYTLFNTEFDIDDKGVILLHNTLSNQDELDDSDFTNWYDRTSLSQETSIKRFGASSAKATKDDYSELSLTGGIWTSMFDSLMFYDDGQGAFYDRHFVWMTARTGAIVAGFGIHNDISTTNYAYHDGSSWKDSSVLRSAGWMRLTLMSINGDPGELTLRLGNNLVIFTSSEPKRVTWLRVLTSNINKPIYIDRIWHNKNASFYPIIGSVVTPKAQPSVVKIWTCYCPTFYSGTTYYADDDNISLESQYTTDGGINWGINKPLYNDNNWEILSNNNLLNVKCDGDGSDAIRSRIILNSDINNMFTPILRQLKIGYLEKGAIINNAILNNALIQ